MADPLEGKTGTDRKSGRPVVRQGGRWVYADGAKLTEDQGKTQTYGRLMAEAEGQYQQARAAGYNPQNPWNAAASFVEDFQVPLMGRPLAGLGPVMRSDDADRGVAAERLWQDAQLKAMTGAGQSEPERIENPRTYFPQFGDAADEQKYATRRTAYEAARLRAGPASRTLPRYPARGGVGPVRVNTPEEAMRLKPGTEFITPDGRKKVR